MRKQLLRLFAWAFLLHSSVALAISPVADEEGDWSWRGGLLGDDTRPEDVFDDGEHFPGYLCEECRDPHEHPMDFAAFAFNGFFGDEPWMWDSQLGIPFRIYNLQQQWVSVWFEGIVFDSIHRIFDGAPVHLMPE